MDLLAIEAEKLVTVGPKTGVMLAVAVTFLIITWTAFACRVFVRAFLIRSWGWDDWMMLVTIILFSPICAFLIAVERLENSDRPAEAIKAGPAAELALIEKIMTLIITFMGMYVLVTVTLKISLAIFFLRVVVRKWQRRVIYTMTTFYTIFGVIFAFVAIFQCGVPRNMILKEAQPDKCIPDDILQILNYLHGSLNAASDWTFALLPITVLWHAQIPRSAKISAGLLLSLGTLGSVISLVRLVYVPGLKNGPNFFHSAITIGTLSVVEPGLGIVAASLATLRPLFKTMVGKTRCKTSSNGSKSKSHDSKPSSKNRRQWPSFASDDKKYLQMNDKPRNMGNFTTVVVGKDLPNKTHELEEMEYGTETTVSATQASTRRDSDPEIDEMVTPAIIGSLQNKAWFPNDEVLMTRCFTVYDEEAQR